MFDEIEKILNLETNISSQYRIVNIGGNVLYIEGIKAVVSFAENEMIFDLKKCGIKVLGNGLKIKYLDKTTVVINGEIFSVSKI